MLLEKTNKTWIHSKYDIWFVLHFFNLCKMAGQNLKIYTTKSYEQFISPIIKAIKELSNKIDILQSELDSLKK